MKYGKVNRMFGRCYFAVPVDDPAEAGDGAGNAGGGSGSAGNAGNGSGKKPEEKKQTFDDLLASGWQSEFDRRINAAVQTAVGNAKEKWKLLTDDKVSEAEKLAKMTDAEKTSYLNKKKEDDLAKREAEITKRELMASAKNTLADKGLPAGLADILVYSDADKCKASIDAVEKAFHAAVQAGVEERLKGKEPPKKAGTDDKTTIEEEVKKALQGHI